MRYAFGILILVVVIGAGCQAPCLFCKTPEPVLASMQGQVDNLRIIENDLVNALEDDIVKSLWKTRLAAFITESRATLAWANKEDFDTKAVLQEEMKE